MIAEEWTEENTVTLIDVYKNKTILRGPKNRNNSRKS